MKEITGLNVGEKIIYFFAHGRNYEHTRRFDMKRPVLLDGPWEPP
jgi:hypothetical protein